MTVFYAVVEGDPLDSAKGSRVLGSCRSTIQGEDGVRRRMTLLGDGAWCDACKSAGEIVRGVDLPDRRRMRDMVSGGRHQAVDGDQVICKCERHPRIISVYGRKFTITYDRDDARAPGDITPHIYGKQPSAESNVPVATHDERFMLSDANGRLLRDTYTQRFGKPWVVSDDGLSFLATWESGILNGVNFQGHHVTDGFILKAYRDNVGIPTVGCGHRIVPSDHIQVGQTISLERARAFKKHDLERMERRLNNDVHVHVPLFQFEYDALVSIVYNCGPNLGADGIIRKINMGNYSGMFDFILTYRIGNNPGLPPRRYTEARLFASGVYDASH
ncbi:MAG TPA: glycoside hydrolase family protein [Paraburkholderia sp.]|nr:glycoside hydrolase family protein [Paraburkholderia sp.]